MKQFPTVELQLSVIETGKEMWFEQAFPGEQHCVTRQKQLPGGQRELNK